MSFVGRGGLDYLVDGRFGNRFDLLLIVVLEVGLFDMFQFGFDLREYSSMYLKSRGGDIFLVRKLIYF